MANYRFKTAEIEAMKKNILTHCKYEREPDRHGNKSAWRLRLVLEGYVMCCRCSKREEARRLRELALYEKLTENDLPNWQDEPTQPATPTEMPQVSTETDERVNVSAEGENEAERAKYRVSRLGGYKIIVGDREQGKVIAVLMAINEHNTIEINDESAHIATMGEKTLEIDKPIMQLSDAEVLELIYNHTEPPQSPGTPQTVECAAEPHKLAQTA